MGVRLLRLPPLRSDTVRAERSPRLSATAALVLDRAADLCLKGWTRVANARDANGNSCYPSSPEATCWCATGALRRAIAVICGPFTSVNSAAVMSYTFAMMRHIIGERDGYSDIERWNDADGRTATEVIDALRAGARAIRARWDG